MLQHIWNKKMITFSTYNFVCPFRTLAIQATKILKLCEESVLDRLLDGGISVGEPAIYSE